MKRVNLLGSYPNPKNKRYVSENLRTIKHRIVASYRGKKFYDGRRIFGYGGLFVANLLQVTRGTFQVYYMKL